jgi:hypothetical protein
VTGDDEQDRVAFWELGLGRSRVLSREGRDAAAERWYRGPHGPTADIAVHAAASCSTCGYLVHLAGGLRQMFGVCANEWSPSDGQVVSLDHGCGAHSETDVPSVEPEPLPEPILDEIDLEPVVLPAREVVEPEAAVPVAEVVAEVSEPGALEVTAGAPGEAAGEVTGEAPGEVTGEAPGEVTGEAPGEVGEVTGEVADTVAPDEDEDLDEPDPEAPAHDVPDPEAPAHAEPDPETPAHEAKLDDPAAADALPEEPEPQP